MENTEQKQEVKYCKWCGKPIPESESVYYVLCENCRIKEYVLYD